MAIVVGGGLVGVVAYYHAWPQAPLTDSDSPSYFAVAADLADGSLDGLHYRPPGYPLLLVATGATEKPTRALLATGLLIHLATVAILAGLILRLGFGSGPAIAVGCILFLPPFVEPAAKVLTEGLAGFCLVLGLACLLPGKRPLSWFDGTASGLAFAASAMVKPTYQLVAPFLALVVLIADFTGTRRRETGKPRRWITAGCLTLSFLLPLLGLAGFNASRFGYFGLSPGNLAYSLSTKTVRVLERLPDRYQREREAMILARDQHLVERDSSHTARQYYPAARENVRRATGYEGRELDALMLDLNLILIQRAPMTYLTETLASMATFWFPTAGPLSFGPSRALQLLWSSVQLAITALFFAQLLLLGGAVLRHLLTALRARFEGVALDEKEPGHDQKALLLGVALVVYTLWVSTLVHHGEARFRIPVDPLIVFLIFPAGRLCWQLADVSSRPAAAP